MATSVTRLLGRLEVRLAGRQTLPTGQVAQFLGYLAYQGTWVGRGELIYLFWPDQPESVARRNLRKLLHRARRQVSGLEADGESLRWPVATDLQAWQDALARHDWRAAGDCYRGLLLDGLEGEGTSEFATWLEEARGTCQRSWQRALSEQTDASGSYPAAAAHLLRRLLDVDPLDEEVVRAYLLCLAAAGQFDDMSRVFNAFTKKLGDDLDLEPNNDLEALVQRLKTQAAAKPVDRARTSVSSKKTRRAAPFLSEASLVGRDRELSRLNELLTLAEQGQGSALALEGEAGVGKTRLVEEFLALSRPAQVFCGRCFERELSVPLEPIRSALATLGDTVTSPLESSGHFWTADPSDRSTVHQSHMAPLLRAARQHPLSGRCGTVLFIDDVQWADAATLEFLSYAVKRVRGEPVLILLSYRREDSKALESWLLPLAERRTLEVARLGRLETAQLGSLLTSVTALQTPDLAWLTELLSRESEGNPFYVMEYLRWLHGAGVTELGSSGRIAALKRENLPEADLPDGVRTLLWARYQGLDEAAREVLNLAAVIGRSFNLSLLEQVSDHAPLALWSTLEPLITAGLISDLSGERYTLSHDKLRQTVYESIGPPVRRSLHDRVARALHAQRADPAELAHHFLRANAWAEAFEQLQEAAQRAERDFAWDVALQGYNRALALCDRLPDADRKRFVLLQAKERLLENMDRRPERAAAAEQLTALAERLGDTHLVAEAQLRQMAVLLHGGHVTEAEEAQERALNLFAELGDTAGQARVYRELAYTAWTNSDYEAMLEANLSALQLYQALNNRRAEASAAWNIAQAYRHLEQQSEALMWAEAAAEIYKTLNDPLGEYTRLNTLAWAHAQQGEVAASAAYLERALPIWEKLNDKHLSLQQHITLGQHLLNADEPRRALGHFEKAAQLGADIGDPRHEGYPLMSLGATLERLDKPERAAEAYRRAARLLETAYTVSSVADEQLAQADALTLLASVLGKAADKEANLQEVLAAFRSAEVIFEQHQVWPQLSKLLMERAALYWRQGSFEFSARDYEGAQHYAKEAGLAEREAAALASLGVVLREGGRYAESVKATSEALNQLRILGDQQAEAYALASLASSYSLLGEVLKAKTCLEASLELRQLLGDAEGEVKVAAQLSKLSGRVGGAS